MIKLNFLFILLSIMFPCFLWALPFKVCHVSSSVNNLLPRANDQTNLYGGFEVAIDDFITKNKLPKESINFITYQSPTESLAVLNGLTQAKKDNCDLIVGLITSKDALIAGPFLVEKKMFGISSTATNDGISKYRSNLLSLSTSASSYLKSFSKWVLDKSLKQENISVIYKSTEVYSLFFKDELQKIFPKANFTNFDQIQNKSLLGSNFKQVKVIFISTYPLESILILKELTSLIENNTNKITIFGTQSWSEIQAFKANFELLNKFKQIYLFSPWDFNNETGLLKEFKLKYKAKFNVLPDHDSVYDYDSMSFSLNCAFDKKTKILSKNKLKFCYENNQMFYGATGNYNFLNTSSHPKRKDFLFDYRKYMEIRRQR